MATARVQQEAPGARGKKAPRHAAGLSFAAGVAGLLDVLLQELVDPQFRDAEPLVLRLLIGEHRVVQLLERRILGRLVGVELEGSLVAAQEIG